jgi:propionyl-CoA carboxylase alpha chain
MKMFSKILIANRGEIACRVIKSARKMGIAPVAVYSDSDREAEHVKMADEAVYIGASPATQSYLVAENIIAACKKTGAQAVHPGYGFLSERASFCDALEKQGITFIGPKAKSIEAMGDKITSKKIAAKAGVSTVPGHLDVITDKDHAALIAKDIGYPVMIKASAGGGGKGMRIAWNDAEAREGFERSRNRATLKSRSWPMPMEIRFISASANVPCSAATRKLLKKHHHHSWMKLRARPWVNRQ